MIQLKHIYIYDFQYSPEVEKYFTPKQKEHKYYGNLTKWV
jgi:hypothetical protein